MPPPTTTVRSGIRSPGGPDPPEAARRKRNAFSGSARSMWNRSGPTASTFATIVVISSAAKASATASMNWKTVWASRTRGQPAARAIAARSVRPDAVWDTKPPVESRLSLSKTMCVRLGGR